MESGDANLRSRITEAVTDAPRPLAHALVCDFDDLAKRLSKATALAERLLLELQEAAEFVPQADEPASRS